MLRTANARPIRFIFCFLFTLTLSACAGSGGSIYTASDPVDETEEPAPEAPEPEASACEGEQYESTFEAVEKIVIERYRCASGGCHSEASAAGSLDLSPGNAWANLHDVDASASSGKRIVPGDARRSLLWTKLAAATLGEETVGSEMPVGQPPLSEDELNLVRWWIYGGAPEDGVVIDAAPYVDGCLPEPEPLKIKPLDVPAETEGIQLVMPTFPLEPGLESERCFASWFDVCDQIPDALKTTNPNFPDVPFFYFDTRELRMDAGSHHLILNYSLIGPDEFDHPDFGDSLCRGGERAGEACEVTDAEFCGEGVCATDHREGFTCGGFGPSVPGAPRAYFPIGGAQRAQDYREYPEGVYNALPCRGALYWNTHTFNLTGVEAHPDARLNYYFADPDNLEYSSAGIFDTSRIFVANNPPFTRETYCHDYVLPQGARLYELTSHTHKHGEYFMIEGPDGELLYENFIYNDPNTTYFSPPREFDDPDPATRTLHYCATYNNGVGPDGLPDVEQVTRSSRVPASARVEGSFGECEPVACVEGNIGADCFDGTRDNAGGDHEACDSSPGLGDGFCDACNITGGESTENEMFLLLGAFYVVDVD